MEVFITSEPEKLPPEIRALLDEGCPQACGATFFEEKFTASGQLRSWLLGGGLMLGGALIFFFGLTLLFTPKRAVYDEHVASSSWWLLGAGAVLSYGGYLLFGSGKGKGAVRRRQERGERTRYGIFLLPDALVSHSWFDTTVIPRAFFRGLDGNVLKYEFKKQAKSFDLPAELVGSSGEALRTAIENWAKAR